MNPVNHNFGGQLIAIVLMLASIGCTAQPGQSADPKPNSSSTFGSSRFGSETLGEAARHTTPATIARMPQLDSSNNGSRNSAIVKPINPQFMDSQTRFSFNLFSIIQKQDPQKNLFISPISISQAIAMLYNGAAGDTQKDMGKVLAIENSPNSVETFNTSQENLRQALEYPDSGIQLSIANSIWTNKNILIKSDFLQTNQRFYQANVESLDFSDRQSPNIINNWVKLNTQGKIDSIIESLRPSDNLILVNATYFKGQWTQAFKPELTSAQNFNAINGKKTVQMMDQQGSYRYLETNDLQAIALPYGDLSHDQRLNLYVLLPKEGKSIADILSKFTQESNSLTQKINPNSGSSSESDFGSNFNLEFSSRPGRIQLPRFKMESQLKLLKPLTTIGMGSIFSSGANFSNLSDRPTQVSNILHKTFVEVNESGTEAAAVTAIVIRSTSVERIQKPFTMKVDRPFLCLLKDDRTGAILFMGAIVDP